MKQTPSYSVLLFDVDGTLLDYSRCAAMAIDRTADKMKLTLPPTAHEDFFSVNADLWRRSERVEIDRYRLYAMRFQMLFDAWKIKADGVAFEKVYQQEMGKTHVPVDGAADLLSYLYGKYTLCVASNANLAFQCERLRCAGFLGYFSKFFCADTPGEEKPTARFFDNCLAAFPGIDRRRVLMIGDSPTADVEGAEGVGIDACWIDPGHIRHTFLHPPHYRVKCLAEIRDLL